MKIVAISDTHNKHKQLDMSKYPKDATLVIAGDITSSGKAHEIVDFMLWVESLDFKYKILIAGNHDRGIENLPEDFAELMTDFKDIIYLENSSITLDGVKFYGTPNTPAFCNWAFNKTAAEMKETWDKVPEDTDVLISHGPPNGVLDLVVNNWSPLPNVGCAAMSAMLVEKSIPYCVVGHIHEQGGNHVRYHNTDVFNASVLNERYEMVNKPTEFIVLKD